MREDGEEVGWGDWVDVRGLFTVGRCVLYCDVFLFYWLHGMRWCRRGSVECFLSLGQVDVLAHCGVKSTFWLVDETLAFMHGVAWRGMDSTGAQKNE